MATPRVICDRAPLKKGRQQQLTSSSSPSLLKTLKARARLPFSMIQGCLAGLGAWARRVCRGGAGAAAARKRYVLASARCQGSRPSEVECVHDGLWKGFCPCCKRPVEMQLASPMEDEAAQVAVPPKKNAYVVVLWGATPEYCLGAMVLAKSLRVLGTPHDLVCVHTDDVQPAAVDLLARCGWKSHKVDYVQGVSPLYNHGEPRFDGVFTKLQAMGLVEYEKVLMLDIDTLVLRSIDSLFELPAPAAMARGPGSGYRHGERIDGRVFFRGSTGGGLSSWGQAWGINAGVMLWRPDEAERKQMLSEVLDTNHPSHVRGNGPEQDYLSRYWASSWSHIGAEYNFQLHQLYYSLHPDSLREPCYADRNKFLYAQPPGEGIFVVHYSGSLKPWSRFLDPTWSAVGSEADAAFAQASVDTFPGYWIWDRMDPRTWRAREPLNTLVLGPEGQLHRVDWSKQRDKNQEDEGTGGAALQRAAVRPSEWTDQDLEELGDDDGGAATKGSSAKTTWRASSWASEWPLGEVVEMPAGAVEGARGIVDRSLLLWNEMYMRLQEELGVASLAELVEQAYAPRPPPPSEAWGWGAAALAPEHPPTEGAPGAARTDPLKAGWQSSGGWWVDVPVAGRASALAGCLPTPSVALSAGGRALLEVRGAAATERVHAVALNPDGGISRLPDDGAGGGAGLAGWLAALPVGALVLLALADAPAALVAQVSAALAEVLLESSVKAVPPEGCRVAVVAGRKGEASPRWQAMSSADFALATLPTNGWKPIREQMANGHAEKRHVLAP